MATSASILSGTNLKDQETDLETWHPPRPRCFAPLKPKGNQDRKEEQGDQAEGKAEQGTKLHGIIFDVDGTLCLPQNYMFREMRSALNIDKSIDILDHIRGLPATPDDHDDHDDTPAGTSELSSPQSRALESIRAIERNAMTSQRPQPGLSELMAYLEERSVPKALCTRNFPAPVQHLIDTFLANLKDGFTAIITRETVGVAPKPSPEGLWWIAKHWGLDQSDYGQNNPSDVLETARKQLGSRIIMVGDSIDDMAAGYRAGAATVLLLNEDNEWLSEHEFVDVSIRRLDDLIGILENGFVGRRT